MDRSSVGRTVHHHNPGFHSCGRCTVAAAGTEAGPGTVAEADTEVVGQQHGPELVGLLEDGLPKLGIYIETIKVVQLMLLPE